MNINPCITQQGEQWICWTLNYVLTTIHFITTYLYMQRTAICLNKRLCCGSNCMYIRTFCVHACMVAHLQKGHSVSINFYHFVTETVRLYLASQTKLSYYNSGFFLSYSVTLWSQHNNELLVLLRSLPSWSINMVAKSINRITDHIKDSVECVMLWGPFLGIM